MMRSYLFFLVLALTQEAFSQQCSWSECSAECGGGVQTRPCTCDVYPGEYCDGNTEQPCNTHDCENCEWSACSVDCGGGTQTRPCTCDYPDGSDCQGNSQQLCNTHDCLNCDWSACSAECGGGMQTRPCQCDSSDPYCEGNTELVCNTQPCLNCDWSECSAECNGGVQTRPCECDAYPGQTCSGDSERSCNTQDCTDCEWSPCSAPCGDGYQTRPCSCDYPDGQCDGNSTRSCNTQNCPGECDWSDCSAPCGGGTQTRPCSCDASPGGYCQGNTERACNTYLCPDSSGQMYPSSSTAIYEPKNETIDEILDHSTDDNWCCRLVINYDLVVGYTPALPDAVHSSKAVRAECDWSDCSVACGGGTQTRPCMCDVYPGEYCEGYSEQPCNTDACPESSSGPAYPYSSTADIYPSSTAVYPSSTAVYPLSSTAQTYPSSTAQTYPTSSTAQTYPSSSTAPAYPSSTAQTYPSSTAPAYPSSTGAVSYPEPIPIYDRKCSGGCLSRVARPSECAPIYKTYQLAPEEYGIAKPVALIESCKCRTQSCSVTDADTGLTTVYPHGAVAYDSCSRRCKCEWGRLVGCCRERKEFRTDMSDAEKKRFTDAVYKASTTQPYKDEYNALITLHETFFKQGIHMNEVFFPWHRLYILKFENLLQKVDCRVTVPYWQWSLEAANPFASTIFQFMGGDGDANDGCVKTGPFASPGWTTTKGQCLKRAFKTGATFATEADIEGYISTNTAADYNTFRADIEGAPGMHNGVHCAIGGTMCGLDASNDPLFFLHHAYIDYLWGRWQDKGSDYVFAYSDTSSLATPMPAFGVPPNVTMDLQNQYDPDDDTTSKICYIQSPRFFWLRDVFNSLSYENLTAIPRTPVSSSIEFLELMDADEQTIAAAQAEEDVRNGLTEDSPFNIISVTQGQTVEASLGLSFAAQQLEPLARTLKTSCPNGVCPTMPDTSPNTVQCASEPTIVRLG